MDKESVVDLNLSLKSLWNRDSDHKIFQIISEWTKDKDLSEENLEFLLNSQTPPKHTTRVNNRGRTILVWDCDPSDMGVLSWRLLSIIHYLSAAGRMEQPEGSGSTFFHCEICKVPTFTMQIGRLGNVFKCAGCKKITKIKSS